MKSLHIYVTIALAVVVLVGVYVYCRNNTGKQTSMLYGTSLTDSALRDMFIQAASPKFDAIAQCVSAKFLQAYTYDEASSLMTEENFKNNTDVKQILDLCTLDVLRSLYAIVFASMENECAKKNPQVVVDWVLAHVEYRIHTAEEVQAILNDLVRELNNVCWSDGATKVNITFTATRIRSLLAESMDERLREPLLNAKKYVEWTEYIATIAVLKYRDAGGRSDVYAENLPKMTGADFDSLSENGFAKIYIQIEMANALFAKWCKGIPELIQAFSPVPFEVYTDQDAGKIMDDIFKQWCWDPALLSGRAQDTLKKTF